METEVNTEQAIEHGLRWLAAGWKWKRGQVAIPQWSDGNSSLLVTSVISGVPHSVGGAVISAVPDMRDDGTRGHALGQVREAWGDPDAVPSCDGDRWSVFTVKADELLGCEATEHEALLAARESAP